MNNLDMIEIYTSKSFGGTLLTVSRLNIKPIQDGVRETAPWMGVKTWMLYVWPFTKFLFNFKITWVNTIIHRFRFLATSKGIFFPHLLSFLLSFQLLNQLNIISTINIYFVCNTTTKWGHKFVIRPQSEVINL